MTPQESRSARRERAGLGIQAATTALTLAVVLGALLWQLRPWGEAAAPRGGQVALPAEQRASAAAPEPVTTLGGLAERYAEERAEARATAARLERMGGMAERYREQANATGAR